MNLVLASEIASETSAPMPDVRAILIALARRGCGKVWVLIPEGGELSIENGIVAFEFIKTTDR